MLRSAAGMTALGLALVAILFVSVNTLTGRLFGGAHLDLTDQQLFSLSDGTKSILTKIDEPITLKLYYSKHLGEVSPGFAVFAERVRELLQEYASRANGKIDLVELDPEPFSDVEDEATEAGLQGVPIDENGEQVYFGLVAANSTDDTDTIAFFQSDREKFLEYDLTKLIQSLAFPKRKVIGLSTGLPLDGDLMAQAQGRPSRPQVIMDQLRQTYDIHTLGTNFDKVPDDIDVLMVVQPEKLQPKTEYAIDQFVLNGGHALVFVDPHSEFQQTHPSPLSPPGSPTWAEFSRVLKSWGVDLVKGKVVGDREAARRVNAGGGGGRLVAADYLPWISLTDDGLAHDDPITGKLGVVNLATAGALMPVEGAKTKIEPLMQSSTQSELIDTEKVRQQPDVMGLLRDFKSTDTRYILAARITGPADTAFPDGPPVNLDAQGNPIGQADEAAKAAQIKTAKTPISVIVVADTDLLDDRFWVSVQDFFGQRVATPQAGNADFVANAVDSLAGSGDLIGLRSRGSAIRPFTLVEEKQRDAQDKYQAEEKSLQDKLKDTQAKLNELKTPEDVDKLTPDQTKAIEQARQTVIQTRQQLRQVNLALREEIDRLKLELVALDVGAVPLIVALAAVVAWLLRLYRRKPRSA
jgi:ABC-type uncharacterized transport system involved in gliding motility auxiliary subunit